MKRTISALLLCGGLAALPAAMSTGGQAHAAGLRAVAQAPKPKPPKPPKKCNGKSYRSGHCDSLDADESGTVSNDGPKASDKKTTLDVPASSHPRCVRT